MTQSTPLLKSPMFVAIVGGAIATLIANVVFMAIPEQQIAFGLVCVALGMCVIFLFCVNWYWMILDYRDSAEGSKARDAYNHLRSNLRGVNKPEDTPFGERYRNEITNKLDGVARWVGDADQPNSDRLCRKLGLDQARPLWTPESYDRCLIMALLYPLVSLFVIWTITGDNGFFEQAFKLTGFESTTSRVGLVAGVFVFTLAARMFSRSIGVKSWFWLFVTVVVAILIAIGVTVTGDGYAFSFEKNRIAGPLMTASSSPVTIAGATVGVIVSVVTQPQPRVGVTAVTVAVTVVVAISSWFTSLIGGIFLNAVNYNYLTTGILSYRNFAIDIISSFALFFFIAFVVASTVISILVKTIRYQRMTFYMVFSILMVIVLAFSPVFLSKSVTWDEFGPLFLFFGVLVLINAPLDWLTLGVTRALLWRGVDRRGLSPFVFGIVDIVVALCLLVFLSMVMILGIQLFNAAALVGVSESVHSEIINSAVFLNPADLVAGMADPATRGNPEYWWVYATLFSTLLPSWLHMLVASGCFVRGSTRLNQLISKELLLGKEGESYLPHVQTKLAVLLALQRTVGLAIATAVFFGGLWFVFSVLFPDILPQLLKIAVPLAESDWATAFVGSIAKSN